MDTPLKILILAGEVSGDMHGAALMKALRESTDRPIIFRGMGGNEMQAEGAQLLYHTDQMAAMGIGEVFRQIRFFKRVLHEMIQTGLEWQPDVVLTIDYAGFNRRVAQALHDQGLKTVQYISPKVWAWNAKRIYAIAKAFDLLLCIFPFEPACYAPTTLKTIFVGHPLVARAEETRREPPPVLPWEGTYRIGLLPGSRRAEIRRILPTLLKAAVRIEREKKGDCSFIIPAVTPTMRREVETVLTAASQKPARLHIIDGQARHVMNQAHAALIASGTATLEASLMLCPTVLTYRVTFSTYLFAKVMIKTLRFVGLTNIIADREVMPELLQYGFTPERAAAALLPLLDDTPQRRKMLADMAEVNAALGDAHASQRAAKAVIDLISG